MKKSLSFARAAAMSVSMTASVFAAAEPTVKVDGRSIMFREEQAPVVMNNRTYVPLRRVLEKMNAKVAWDGTTGTITIDSSDNIIRLIMTINNPEIEVYTFTSVLHADKSIVTSDAAPVIMNNRTMIPIRVVAEALGATVQFSSGDRCVDITSKAAKTQAKIEGVYTDSESFNLIDVYKDNLPKLTLSADSENIGEDGKVTLKLKLSDLEKAGSGIKFCSTTVSIVYDGSNFAYKGYQCIKDGEKISPALSADNGTFTDNSAKIITLFMPENAYVPDEDGTIMEIYFSALSDKGGNFSISDGISPLGNNTELIVTYGEDDLKTIASYDELYIDTTPVVIK